MGKGGGSSSTTHNYSPIQEQIWDFGLGGLRGFSRASPFSQMTGPEQWFTGQQEWMGKHGHDIWRQRMEEGLRGMTDANSGYLSKVVSPALTNKMTAMGMGRSGAIGENLAMAAVPMAQQEAQARLAFEQASPQMEQMFSMLGLGAAGRQREMSQQDFLRQQQLAMAALQQVPQGPTSMTQKQGSGGFMSSLLPLAALGMIPFTGGTSLFGMMGGGLGSALAATGMGSMMMPGAFDLGTGLTPFF